MRWAGHSESIKERETHAGFRDSSVGTATRYGLDGPGIKSRWGPDFPNPSRPALRLTQSHVQCVPSLLPGCSKATEEWRWQSAPSRAVYPPSGLSWPFLGWTSVFRRVRKLRKANTGFIMSVCWSAIFPACPPTGLFFRLSAWNNSDPTVRIFMKFDIWVIFENLSRKFKFH